MADEETGGLEGLQDELLGEIFTHLSTEDTVRLLVVSKRWYQLLASSYQWRVLYGQRFEPVTRGETEMALNEIARPAPVFGPCGGERDSETIGGTDLDWTWKAAYRRRAAVEAYFDGSAWTKLFRAGLRFASPTWWAENKPAIYMRHALWLGTFLAAPCAEDDVLGFLELDAVELDDGGDGTDGALGESTGLDGVMAVVHGVWYEGPRLDGGPRALAVAPFRGEAVRALKALLRMDARDMEAVTDMFLARRNGLLAAYPWVDLTEFETTLAVMSTQGGRGRLDAFIWDLHYVCMHDLFGEATTMAEAGLVSSLHPRGGDVVFKADATQEIQIASLRRLIALMRGYPVAIVRGGNQRVI